jgi:hypothetical protein
MLFNAFENNSTERNTTYHAPILNLKFSLFHLFHLYTETTGKKKNLSMLSAQRPSSSTTTNEETNQDHDNEQIRDIHALTPPHPPPRNRWETGSNHHGSYSMSMSSEGASGENFTTMSREFNALVIAGSAIGTSNTTNNSSSDRNDLNDNGSNTLLSRFGEDDDVPEETNPLAIVPDNHPLDPEPSSRMLGSVRVDGSDHGGAGGEVSVLRVKKEEVETKITAWQNAKIAKINNRFKREDAIINGWESEQVQKSTSWMKKVEVRTSIIIIDS